MTLEAAAGKNPVSHVGKLYNVAAGRISAAIADRIAAVRDVATVLVSRIGQPVNEPETIDVRLVVEKGVGARDVQMAVERVVSAELTATATLREALLEGSVRLF
jgi:S-adenosylmethionine synthetase